MLAHAFDYAQFSGSIQTGYFAFKFLLDTAESVSVIQASNSHASPLHFVRGLIVISITLRKWNLITVFMSQVIEPDLFKNSSKKHVTSGFNILSTPPI